MCFAKSWIRARVRGNSNILPPLEADFGALQANLVDFPPFGVVCPNLEAFWWQIGRFFEEVL